MRRSVPHLLVAPVAVVAFALTASCSTADPGPDGPTAATPSGALPSSPAPSSSSPTAVPGRLTVVARDATDRERTWTLTCDPAGGSHPDPAAACAALTAQADTALPPVAKDAMCTQVYGGPETASITGTWQGRTVRSTFSRTNGCEIARWNLLKGLLPSP